MKKILNHIKRVASSAIKGFSAIPRLLKRKKGAEGESFTPKTTSKRQLKLSSVFSVIIIIIALVQIVFAVMVYGFKKEDVVTRAVAAAVPYPIAMVNYTTISYNDYLAEKDYVHHFYAATKQESVNLKDVDAQVLDQLTENKILSFEARHYGVKVSKTDIDTAINGIIDQNGGQDKVEKVLGEMYNLDLKSFRRLVENQLLRDKVSNTVIMRITARHILVRIAKDAPQDQVDQAKEKIDGYLKDIKAGADFADVAKKNSEDVGSSDQGGELTPFAEGEMVPEFSKAAFATPVGQISDPVRTDFGWHIIKVEAKTGAVDQSFTDWIANSKKHSLIIKLI